MAFDVEQLFKAMDIIVNKRLQDVSFDKTIICTVIDDSQSSIGKYVVTDGGTKFNAYSQDIYKNNDQVRVTVLEGDFTSPKYIVGKHITGNQPTLINYSSPLDTMVNMSGNLFSNSKPIGIVPNDETVVETELGIIDLLKNVDWDIKDNSIYDVLSIRAEFKCDLDYYDVREGNYGIKLVLKLPETAKTIYFDSSEFFGNPYSMSIWTLQEKKFDITTLENIQNIQLFLYQRNNFITAKKARLNFNNIEGNFPIQVKDIQLSLGNELIKVPDNTLKIRTQNDATTFNILHDIASNSKEISLIWYNKDNNANYIGFSDGIYDSNYDEDAYEASIESHNRLSLQMSDSVPNDVEALAFAADIQDINTYLDKSKNYINKDIYNAFRSLRQSFVNAGAASDNPFVQFVDNYINTGGILDELVRTISTKQKENNEYCFAWLNYLAHKDTVARPSLREGLLLDLEDIILSCREQFLIDIEELRNQIATDYVGYKNVFDKFINLMNIYAPKVDETFDSAFVLIGKREDADNYLERLNQIINKEQFEPLGEIQGVDKYANKYCIYWYKKDKSAEDKHTGAGWKRIDDLTNKGLPSTAPDSIYHAAKSNEKVIVSLDPKQQTEEIKAILFFNHEKYESNILTYTNAQEVINESAVDKAVAVQIIHKENSNSHYPIYAPDGQCLNMGEKRKIRKLKANFVGVTLTEDDLINSATAQIFWYLPKSATMINYNGVNYADYRFTLLADSEEVAKEGYYCLYKQIEDAESLEFPYAIESHYIPQSVRNDLICNILFNNESYEASTYLTFGYANTNGTSYSLVFKPAGLYQSVPSTGALQLSACLLDADGQIVSLTNDDVLIADLNQAKFEGFTIIPSANYRFVDGSIQHDENYATCEIQRDNNVKSEVYAGLVKSEISLGMNGQKTVLAATIPLSYSTNNYYADGATSITYNSLGANPIYSEKPYRLYNSNGVMESDVIWQIRYSDNEGKILSDSTVINFLPKLVESKGEYYLRPNAMYISNIDNCFTEIQAVNGIGEIVWAQTILITQDKYSSNLLNDWDGSFQINEENKTLMSAILGAGKKDEGNTFTGVLMGDLQGENGAESGLFGYRQGLQTFGFRTDGTAFIGGAGMGRIEFNGTSGIIQSYNYSKDNRLGMQIDLQHGAIDAYNFKLTSNHLLLDSSENAGTNTPYFQIIGNDYTWKEEQEDGSVEEIAEPRKVLIHISDSTNYIQSLNYRQGIEGVRFDLQEGTLNIGPNFSVTKDGHVNASHITITDEDSISSIAGWRISGKTLASENNSIILDAENGRIELQSPKVRSGGLSSIRSGARQKDDGTTSYDFQLTSDGEVISKNIKISGDESYIGGGKIGGWEITDTSIIASTYGYAALFSNSPKLVVNGVTKEDWSIVTGDADDKGFGVDQNGILYSRGAFINQANFTDCIVKNKLNVYSEIYLGNSVATLDNQNGVVENEARMAGAQEGRLNFYSTYENNSKLCGSILPVRDDAALATKSMLLFEKKMDGRMRFTTPRLEIYPWRTNDTLSDGNKISYTNSTSIDISWENVRSVTWNQDFCKMNIKFNMPKEPAQNGYSLQELVNTLSDSFEIYYGKSAKIQWVKYSEIESNDYIPILVKI